MDDHPFFPDDEYEAHGGEDRADAPEPPEQEPDEFKFRIEALSKIRLERRPSYLIKGLMPARQLMTLYGQPGVGKSFVALHAALHIASGREWAGRKVRKGAVIYVASEGGHGFRTRIIAATKQYGFPADLQFGLITEAPNLGQPGGVEKLIDDIQEQREVLGDDPVLIVLDTLACSAVGLDESSSMDMGKFVDNAKRLSKRFDCLVMPIHHSGKDPGKGMRGSSALNAAVDAQWFIEKSEDGKLSVVVEKMKEGVSGVRATFRLDPVHLGVDAEGDDIETLVVGSIGTFTKSDATKRKDSKPSTRDAVLEKIKELIAEHGATGASRAQGLTDDMMAMRSRDLKSKVEEAFVRSGRFSSLKSADAGLHRDFQDLLKNELREAGGWMWVPDAVAPQDDMGDQE